VSVQSTAGRRRRLAIDVLGRQLDRADPESAAARLAVSLGQPRPMVVSADIDGLVSAAMLASVAPWKIVGFVVQSTKLVLHPSVTGGMPDDLVAVDLFSLRHDSISNHVVRFGDKRPRLGHLSAAWQEWDAAVDAAAAARLMLVPSIWARTQGCYEDADKVTSSKFKYPLGSAQILLALLEAAGHPPRFYDRHYLPWLVANCDGGVATYSRHAYNARVWWPVMAGAVGPASLTEQVFRMVDEMRPHDFLDTVNALDRERQANDEARWLDDDWNLADASTMTLRRTLRWLCDLTGWRDPVRSGLDAMAEWQQRSVNGQGLIYLGSDEHKKVTAATEADAVASIGAAQTAVNANFYHGGFSGSRFNWAGGW